MHDETPTHLMRNVRKHLNTIFNQRWRRTWWICCM